MRDVAIKHSQCRTGTYTRVLCDDGHFFGTHSGWMVALEHVLSRFGARDPIYISTNTLNDFYANARRVARVFPTVTIGRPYDLASRALYDELRAYPDLIDRSPADSLIVIGADASVPRHARAHACWVRLTPNAPLVVHRARAPHDVCAAETTALLSAVLDRMNQKSKWLTVAHSDSQHAVNAVSTALTTGRTPTGERPHEGVRRLYARAREMLDNEQLHVRWVRGHNGDLANTLADQVARGIVDTPVDADDPDGHARTAAAYAGVERLLDSLSDHNPERLLAEYRQSVLDSLNQEAA